LLVLLFTRAKSADLVLLAILIAHFIVTNAYRISGEAA
jgi:hypothetical protein